MPSFKWRHSTWVDELGIETVTQARVTKVTAEAVHVVAGARRRARASGGHRDRRGAAPVEPGAVPRVRMDDRRSARLRRCAGAARARRGDQRRLSARGAALGVRMTRISRRSQHPDRRRPRTVDVGALAGRRRRQRGAVRGALRRRAHGTRRTIRVSRPPGGGSPGSMRPWRSMPACRCSRSTPRTAGSRSRVERFESFDRARLDLLFVADEEARAELAATPPADTLARAEAARSAAAA